MTWTCRTPPLTGAGHRVAASQADVLANPNGVAGLHGWCVAAGMCRAQGIAHQRVSSPEELSPALHSAWALHRHSVVEVITGRDSNVDQHRQLQAAVQQAVSHAIRLLTQSASGKMNTSAFPPLVWQCHCPIKVNVSNER